MTVSTKRRALSPTQRLKMFEAHGGRCVLCGGKIVAGEKWIDEHLRALGLGGSNEWENRGPAHAACAKAKTADDLPRIAKAKRQKMASLGIKPARRSWPGGRGSQWKKKLDGSVVPR